MSGIVTAACTAACLVGGSAGAQTGRSTPPPPQVVAGTVQSAGGFVVRHGKDTLSIERFERISDRMRGVIQAHSGERGEYNVSILPDALVSRLELIAFGPTGQPTEHGVATFTGDTVVIEAGANQVRRIPTKRGAEPWVNPSFAFAELLVQRARVLGGNAAVIPLFTIQGGATVPATVTKLAGDSVSIDLSGIMLRMHVDAAGRLLGGTVPAQGVVITRVAATPAR